jgi:hypothetical protein
MTTRTMMTKEDGNSNEGWYDECKDNDDDVEGSGAAFDTKDGYKAARLLVVPKGYFLGAPRNVMAITKAHCLGIQYDGAIYLRYKLGQKLFGELVMAHGVVNPYTPIEANWHCLIHFTNQ